MRFRGAFVFLFLLLLAGNLPGQVRRGDGDVDDSASFFTDRQTTRQMDKAEESILEERWTEALRHLGIVLNGKDDYLFQRKGATDKRMYHGLKSFALETIGRMPPDGRQEYELQYGAEARSYLNEALASGDPRALADVARRYFHTPAGYEATLRLGMHHFDHGRPLEAYLSLSRLRQIESVRARFEPMLSLQTAICLTRVGNEDTIRKARQILLEMKQYCPDNKVRIADQEVPLFEQDADALKWLQKVLGPYVQQAPPSNEEWVMYRGGPSRNATTLGGSPLLNYRWRVPVSNDKPKVEKFVKQLQDNYRERGLTALPTMHPLAVKLDLREASRLSKGAIRNWDKFVGLLQAKSQESHPSAAKRIWFLLSQSLQDRLRKIPEGEIPSQNLQQQVVDELNALFARNDFYDATAWGGVERKRIEAINFLKRGPDNLNADEIYRMNRVLLEAAFWPDIALSYSDVVLVRSFNNLVAIDFVTGKRVWEVPIDDKDQLEQLVNSTKGDSPPAQLAGALVQRLWKDSTFGTLSSDGERVFAIEDLELQTSGSNRRRIRVVIGGNRRGNAPKDYNRLAAYDIRTGKLKWEKGGEKGEFELELAGMFFLGPPLPLAGQLYVLAEANSEVRLIVLDAKTGSVQWTQTLALVQRPLYSDPIRPYEGLSPSYSDGVLVCPTASGAVVAVDLANRALLWGRLYPGLPGSPNRRAFFGGARVFPANAAEMERWTDSLPTVADGRVVLTPAESNEVYCLDLFTGDLLWKRPREDGMYVAAIVSDKAVIVGKRQVVARGLSNGEIEWKTPLPTANSSPSGRGFLSKGHYYLPLSTGEVVRMDTSNGRITARATSRSADQVVPGNLICFRGTVISQGIDFIYRFDELTQLEQQIEEDLRRNPNDADALAKRGEILMQKGFTQDAVVDLRKSLNISPGDRTRELLIDSLLEGLRVGFERHRDNIDEIAGLLEELPPAKRDPKKAKFLRVVALGLHRSGNKIGAFKTWLEFVDPLTLERMDGGWSVRRDRLVQGKILDLYRDAAPDEKKVMDTEIRSRYDLVKAESNPELLQKFVNYFGTHPVANLARVELADHYLEQGKQIEAETVLLHLAGEGEQKLAGPATAKLARLFEKAGRFEDASLFYRRAAQRFADDECLDGKSGKELLASLAEGHPVHKYLAGAHLWPQGTVASDEQKKNSGHVRRYPVQSLGRTGPFFGDGGVELDQTQQTLMGRDPRGEVQWHVKLNTERGKNVYYSFNPYANRFRASGHLVMLWTGQRVFAVNTLTAEGKKEAELLWHEDLNESVPGVAAGRRVRFNIVNGPGGRRVIATDMFGQELSPIGPVGTGYVCFQRRRELVAVDPLTGDELWIRHDLTPGSHLFGDDEYVFVVAPQSNQAVQLRALDGQKVGTIALPEEDDRLATYGRSVISWRTEGNKRVLSRMDLVQREAAWKYDFAADAQTALVDMEEMAVVDSKGRMKIIDLDTGKVNVEAQVEAQPRLSNIYLIRSDHRYLLVTNEPWQQKGDVNAIYPVSGGIDNPVITGFVHGFDRKTGKKLWSTRIDHQALSLRQPRELPVLIFACRLRLLQGRKYSNEYAMACLNKEDGKIVYEYRGNQSIGGFEATAEHDKKQVVISTPRSVITLKYKDKQPQTEKKN